MMKHEYLDVFSTGHFAEFDAKTVEKWFSKYSKSDTFLNGPKGNICTNDFALGRSRLFSWRCSRFPPSYIPG